MESKAMQRRLSPAQQKARDAHGHTLIVACAGSGKTTTVAHRSSRILKSGGTRVCAVTFTAEAAAELGRRIRDFVPDRSRSVVSGTFHRLCGRQLKTARLNKPLAPAWRCRLLIKKAFAQVGPTELSFSETAEEISKLKSLSKLPVNVTTRKTAELLDVYSVYCKEMAAAGVWDFSDIIQNAVLAMREGTIKPIGVSHLMVDEFQDTDEIQLEWILHHARAGVEITAVGDDDQSIYGWRSSLGYGAMRGLCDALQVSTVHLGESYRCPGNLIDHAARLIDYNQKRLEKKLSSALPGKAGIRAHVFSTHVDEADAIVDAISEASTGSWGILARSNRLLDDLEVALIGADIPYDRPRSESFWQLQTPGLVVGILKGLHTDSFQPMLALFEVCPDDAQTASELKSRYRHSRNGSLHEFLQETIDDELIRMLQSRIPQWKNALENNRWRMALSAITDAVGIFGRKHVGKKRVGIRNNFGRSMTTEVEKSKFISLSHLASVKKALLGLRGNLGERLRFIESGDSNDSTAAVRLMTIHGSKGLEFDNVWIIGLEEGVFPTKDSDMEEERRLAYVAMTRTIHQLTVSRTLHGNDDARGELLQPSRFIQEAGLNIYEPQQQRKTA